MNCLAIFDQIEVAEEVDISEKMITVTAMYDAMRDVAFSMLVVLVSLFIFVDYSGFGIIGSFTIFLEVLATLYFAGKVLMLTSPLRRLKIFANGIRKAMLTKGMIQSENCKVVVKSEVGIYHAVYLMGGNGKEKDDFAKCVKSFFDEIDNQRYILYNTHKKNRLDGYFAVPDMFARRKEDAELFAACMRPFIGKYEMVYTRSEGGRKILLEARVKALGNRQERCLHKKKVKGALE